MIANEERSQSARGKEYQGSTKDGGKREAKGRGRLPMRRASGEDDSHGGNGGGESVCHTAAGSRSFPG